MNVFVINGSPKGNRSNTYRLTSAFLEGMKANSELTVTEVNVSQVNIRPCLGCFSCWNKTPGQCCLKDDMEEIIQSMLWADVIIWSFPLYYFSVPGPLKNFMDRQLPMVLPFMDKDTEKGGHPGRYDMSGKRHVVISTCGFYTAEGNYDGVEAIFTHLCGKGNYTSIFCGQGELFRVKELRARTDAYLAHVKRAGEEFCNGHISRETRENLSQLLYPRHTFEAMADASWGVEKTGEQADESLTFTKQMAALYNPSAYSGKERILEMHYTDIEKRYQIVMGKDGAEVLSEGFQNATTTIETTYTLWKSIAAGEVSGEDALMERRYRVKGDFDVMIHWNRYFGSEDSEKSEVKNVKKTNMAMLLIPWMVLWICASSVEAYVCALISIGVSVLTPVVFWKNTATRFDQISALLVTACCILILLDVPLRIILPLSYFLFGLLWTVTGFTKIPLTAHYSVNDYGNGMMDNPLFIKTNRILTLCWGILYLAMTAWTFPLLQMGSSWISTLNSILPMFMGIFTVWFQKWYPAYVARGRE